jgi:hypothetical protein
MNLRIRHIVGITLFLFVPVGLEIVADWKVGFSSLRDHGILLWRAITGIGILKSGRHT